MKVEIKSYNSPDVLDLQNYIPEEADNFGFLLQVIIGPEGQKGGESFDFEICTPKWFCKKHKRDVVVFARFMVFVFEYDFNRILKNIVKLVSSASRQGKSWQDVAMKIARYGHWEFEDYQE